MPQDLDLLQGSWTVATLEVDGQPMPPGMLSEARIVIKGRRFTSTGMGADYKGTLALNASTKPCQLDMKFDAGPEKGNTNLGIYELEGDRWRLCLAMRGSVRPAGFAAPRGSGFALETLVRGGFPAASKKAPSKTKAATTKPAGAPATEFEGEWRMISAVMDGQPMEESAVQWVKRVTHGNQTTVYAGPQMMMKFEFTCDPLQSPKAIDYVNLAGPNKGKAQRGIYELEGNLLKVCVAAPGDARPAQFQSERGSGHTFTVWKRA